MIRLSDYDYDLPMDLIAQHPIAKRDESRLLVVDRKSRSIAHRRFREIVEYLCPGDVLVLNDTKVIRARLMGRRATGGKVEALLLRQTENDFWEALFKPSSRLKPFEQIDFEGGAVRAELVEPCDEGVWVARFMADGDLLQTLEKVGRVPLPPYIKRTHGLPAPADAERYQTVYARRPGAVAAPTAGLHFTPALLDKIKAMGVNIAYITLHVGLGTFKPITVEDVSQHKMHSEWFEVTEAAAEAINAARRAGKRIVAVGTTACRVLESAVGPEGIVPQRGMTDIFIYPPYKFRSTDALITNFHLPRTTLLLLVCAFAGRELIMTAYKEAIQERYRFYSYGDAMLVL